MIVENLMTYDYEDHRYILKKDTVKNKLGFDLDILLNTNYTAELFLDEISRQVYNYLYEDCIRQTQKILEYRIYNEDDARDGIMWAMLDQIQYSKVSTGTLLKDMHGIDFNTGVTIDFNELNKRSISNETRKTLRRYNLHPKRYTYNIDHTKYRVDY